MAQKPRPEPRSFSLSGSTVNLALAQYTHAEEVDDDVVDDMIRTAAALQCSPMFNALWRELAADGRITRNDMRFLAAKIFIAGSKFGGAK